MTGQLTIGQYKTYDDFGLRLLMFPELSPPAVKTNLIDIPGGNGCIDLTESSTGDATYENRVCSFEFDIEGDFEATKTKVYNALHGRKFDYVIPSDPDYTYTGRVSVSEVSDIRIGKGRIKLSIDTDPFKLLANKTFRVNAMGGIVVTLDSGRKPVCPVFEFANETLVEMGDTSVRMQAGTYKLSDLWFREGVNGLYLNSYLGEGNTSIADFADDTIGEQANKRISELAWNGIRGGAIALGDWAKDTLAMHANETVIESSFAVPADSERYAVYIQYDWRDI